MAHGFVIDPLAKTTTHTDVDLNDFRLIQDAIGGHTFEEHQAFLGASPVGRVFMAENRAALASQESFQLSGLTIAGHLPLRIYGTALFVPHQGHHFDHLPDAVFFSHDEAIEAAKPVVRAMDDAELGRWFANKVGGDPSQTFVKSFPAREAREFIPRPVGTFTSNRCSVAELEAAFLGFHEWVRKGSRVADPAMFARAFEAPPFFFPDGLSPTTEEFQAGCDAEAGALSLPFPMEAFWIVRWDMWLGGGPAGEGPALLYVEENEEGFATIETFCERGSAFHVGAVQQHDRLRRSPHALVTALHRLNNRRVLIERDVTTPELHRINAGRMKSKRGLSPLPSFIRVTGRVPVGPARPSHATGIERCRHDRRGHWRKRRRGVELPQHEWVRVRPSTIHPEKPARPANPYVVV